MASPTATSGSRRSSQRNAAEGQLLWGFRKIFQTLKQRLRT